MKKTINFDDFVDSFSSSYQNNFSYEGKRALFDYLEEYEDSTDEQIELDTVALCCEYSEYENIEEFNKNHNKKYTSSNQIDETTVIEIEDSERFIIQDF